MNDEKDFFLEHFAEHHNVSKERVFAAAEMMVKTANISLDEALQIILKPTNSKPANIFLNIIEDINNI